MVNDRPTPWRPRSLPTGLATVLTGALVFIAALYFQHRSASPWVLGLAAALLGAGAAMLLLATGAVGHSTPSLLHAALSGAGAGLVVLLTHMAITNPNACAVASTGMLIFGGPWVGGIGAAGSLALVGILRRQRGGLAARGGDRAMLAVLLVALIVCAVAIYPFAHNALAYSRPMTGVSIRIQPVRDTQGGTSVLAGEHVLVMRPWGGGSVSIDVYDLTGAITGHFGWVLPEGAAGVQPLLVDLADGTPYVGWAQRMRSSQTPPGDDETWQAVLARLNASAGAVVQTWTFPVETPWARLGLVHMGHAVVVREGYITCYALPGADGGPEAPGGAADLDSLPQPAFPIELWRVDVPGTDLMQAAAGTLVVATYDAQPACYEVASGRRLWLVDGTTYALPVFDDVNQVWAVITRDAVIGLKASSEGAVWGFGREPLTHGSGAAMAIPYASAGHLLLIERASGPAWDWPPVNVRLTRYSTSDGQLLARTMVERDAFQVVGQAGGVTWISGMYGLLLGVDLGGRPLFRTRGAGPVSAVVDRPDGPDSEFLLLGDQGLQAGRLRR